MDFRTVKYYDDHADDVFAQYSSGRSGIEKYFALAFPPGAEILDIGAGSGRIRAPAFYIMSIMGGMGDGVRGRTKIQPWVRVMQPWAFC